MLANWVSETTATTGTGTISLGGAASADVLPVSAQFSSGDYVSYTIKDNNNREAGVGIVTSGSPWTLARNIVHEKLEGGVHSIAPSVGLDLSGNAVVSLNIFSQSEGLYLSDWGNPVTGYGHHLVGINLGGSTNDYYEQTPNLLRLVTHLCPRPFLLSKLTMEVTTSASGAQAKIGIWKSVSENSAGDVIAESGLLDCSTTGYKSYSFTPILMPAGLYCVGCVSNNASFRQRAFNGISGNMIGGGCDEGNNGKPTLGGDIGAGWLTGAIGDAPVTGANTATLWGSPFVTMNANAV